MTDEDTVRRARRLCLAAEPHDQDEAPCRRHLDEAARQLAGER